MTRTDESGPAADRTASKNSTDTTMVARRADIATAARHARAAQSRGMGSIVLAAMVALGAELVAGWVR